LYEDSTCICICIAPRLAKEGFDPLKLGRALPPLLRKRRNRLTKVTEVTQNVALKNNQYFCFNFQQLNSPTN
jgi:hypothetical protein